MLEGEGKKEGQAVICFFRCFIPRMYPNEAKIKNSKCFKENVHFSFVKIKRFEEKSGNNVCDIVVSEISREVLPIKTEWRESPVKRKMPILLGTGNHSSKTTIS